MPRIKLLLALALLGLPIAGCFHHEVEVKPIPPIHITLDIRIQQQVDQSLQFVQQARGIEGTPASMPSSM